jgi:hypothetical protein
MTLRQPTLRKERTMKKMIATMSAACLLVGLSYAWGAAEKTGTTAAGAGLLSHSVYFSLNDATPEARQKLVDSCKKLLSQHAGVVFFSAGTLCDEIKGGFNDRDFDVVLLMVFTGHEALHDYARSESHQKFIAENAPTFKKVRIFDADVDRVAVPDDARAAK